MLDSHIAEQLPATRAAGRREDLGSGLASDRDRRLTDTAGRGVDQHAVAGPDPGKVAQPVPRGAVSGGDRGGLLGGQAGRQWRDQPCVAGDVRAPASAGAETADFVADPVLGDPGPDGGDHTREIQAELRLLAVERRVAAEGGQHIGEVDAGGADRDFDLSGRRCRPLGGDQLQGLQITGGADLQPHAVGFGVGEGGPPLLGPQRSPAAAAPRTTIRLARPFRPRPSRSVIPVPADRRRCGRRRRSGSARSGACSAPITRISPRTPPWSRLTRSSGVTACALRVTT